MTVWHVSKISTIDINSVRQYSFLMYHTMMIIIMNIETTTIKVVHQLDINTLEGGSGRSIQ